MKLLRLLIWHNDVVEVACEGSHKQRRRKGNVEWNVTEGAVLLKQQPEQKNTNWLSPEQKDRPNHTGCVAACVAPSDNSPRDIAGSST